MTAQGENLLGGHARGILERIDRRRGLVGLQGRESLVRSRMGNDAGGIGRGCGCPERVIAGQRDSRPRDAPCRLVGQRSAHTEVFLRIAGIRSAEDGAALDRKIDGQHRTGHADGDPRSAFGGAFEGDIGILGRGGSAATQQGQGQKTEFHNARSLDTIYKCNFFSRAVKISGKNRA